ncbi:hypothetical protein [Rhizobium sp. MHM7A]|uniref:hypothetical protein n=1 Tax=Rhizobium sp. MHM7A TaxID=2583233 RepID=UPI001105A6DE|nr:hypothetical protein [Rhizobium sp. MHM7A]TLX16484.1 hypothetical protein FFR93_03870 [Rhizobium sp. MHM7A]
MASADILENRSRHHGWMPSGRPGIAISPYRIHGGISAVLALSAAVGVGYDAGYPGGAMFIEYPTNLGDVSLIDELIDEAYKARVD